MNQQLPCSNSKDPLEFHKRRTSAKGFYFLFVSGRNNIKEIFYISQEKQKQTKKQMPFRHFLITINIMNCLFYKTLFLIFFSFFPASQFSRLSKLAVSASCDINEKVVIFYPCKPPIEPLIILHVKLSLISVASHNL